MQTSSLGSLFSWSRDRRGFAIGMLFGAALAITGTAWAEDDDPAANLMQTVLYTLAALATDTEQNATSIAALRERLNDLELEVAEIAGDKN